MKITRRQTQKVTDQIIKQAASAEGLSEAFLAMDAFRIIPAKMLNKAAPYASGQHARQALTKATTVNGGMTAWGAVGEILIAGLYSAAYRGTDVVVERDNKSTHDLRCTRGRLVRLSENKLATLTQVSLNRWVAHMNISRPQFESNSDFVAALASLDFNAGPMTARYIVCPMSVIRWCWENSGQSKNDRYSLRVYFDRDGNLAGNGKIAKALAPYIYTGAEVVEAVRKLKTARNS